MSEAEITIRGTSSTSRSNLAGGSASLDLSSALAGTRNLAEGSVLTTDTAVVSHGSATAANGTREFLRGICSFPAALAGLLVGAVFVLERAFILDPDLWWHIKTGEFILSTRRWFNADPYSYTAAGAPWMSCEWLGDVLLATVHRIGGVQGLYALLVVLGSTIVLALYALALLRSRNCKAALFATALLLPLTGPSFNLRPQMVGYLFLVLTLIIMERLRQGKARSIWWLPLLFVIWVNTHGSWIIGIGVVGLYIACGLKNFQVGGLRAEAWTKSERLQLEMVFMLSLAIIPITPYGVRLAGYPFTVASSLPISLANVVEWRVMPFDLSVGKIFLMLVLGFFLAQVAFRFSWRLEELLLFLFGAGMACLHVRFLLLFVPFFAPLAAVILARWAPPYFKQKDHVLTNLAVIITVTAAMVYYFPSRSELDEKVANQFPVDALKYIKANPVPGPLFNSYRFGGFMVESGYKTFIDGRSELFEQTGVLGDYMHIIRLKPGALKVLQGYGIRACLVERDDPLSVMLASLPGWRKIYSDNLSAIYTKREPGDAQQQPAVDSSPGAAR